MGWRWLEDEAFDEAFKDFVDEEAREKELDRREPLVRSIATRLDEIDRDDEQARWARADRHEDGDEDPGPDPFEDLEEDERAAAEAEAKLQQDIRAAQHQAEIDVLEERLAELGARRARVYEHWNEDERLVAYMERDRD